MAFVQPELGQRIAPPPEPSFILPGEEALEANRRVVVISPQALSQQIAQILTDNPGLTDLKANLDPDTARHLNAAVFRNDSPHLPPLFALTIGGELASLQQQLLDIQLQEVQAQIDSLNGKNYHHQHSQHIGLLIQRRRGLRAQLHHARQTQQLIQEQIAALQTTPPTDSDSDSALSPASPQNRPNNLSHHRTTINNATFAALTLLGQVLPAAHVIDVEQAHQPPTIINAQDQTPLDLTPTQAKLVAILTQGPGPDHPGPANIIGPQTPEKPQQGGGETTPIPQATAVARGNINIRQLPSTESDILDRSNSGQEFTVFGRAQGSDNYWWYLITFTHPNGQVETGWVREDVAPITDGDSETLIQIPPELASHSLDLNTIIEGFRQLQDLGLPPETFVSLNLVAIHTDESNHTTYIFRQNQAILNPDGRLNEAGSVVVITTTNQGPTPAFFGPGQLAALIAESPLPPDARFSFQSRDSQSPHLLLLDDNGRAIALFNPTRAIDLLLQGEAMEQALVMATEAIETVDTATLISPESINAPSFYSKIDSQGNLIQGQVSGYHLQEDGTYVGYDEQGLPVILQIPGLEERNDWAIISLESTQSAIPIQVLTSTSLLDPNASLLQDQLISTPGAGGLLDDTTPNGVVGIRFHPREDRDLLNLDLSWIPNMRGGSTELATQYGGIPPQTGEDMLEQALVYVAQTVLGISKAELTERLEQGQTIEVPLPDGGSWVLNQGIQIILRNSFTWQEITRMRASHRFTLTPEPVISVNNDGQLVIDIMSPVVDSALVVDRIMTALSQITIGSGLASPNIFGNDPSIVQILISPNDNGSWAWVFDVAHVLLNQNPETPDLSFSQN